jgi:hypothetical protein
MRSTSLQLQVYNSKMKSLLILLRGPGRAMLVCMISKNSSHLIILEKAPGTTGILYIYIYFKANWHGHERVVLLIKKAGHQGLGHVNSLHGLHVRVKSLLTFLTRPGATRQLQVCNSKMHEKSTHFFERAGRCWSSKASRTLDAYY